jgi:hypothetical protein
VKSVKALNPEELSARVPMSAVHCGNSMPAWYLLSAGAGTACRRVSGEESKPDEFHGGNEVDAAGYHDPCHLGRKLGVLTNPGGLCVWPQGWPLLNCSTVGGCRVLRCR